MELKVVNFIVILTGLVNVFGLPVAEEDLLVSIIHLNDFHARFDETRPDSTPCRPGNTDCIGGFARVTTEIKRLLAERPNPLLLNAGDNYQGSVYFTLFKWEIMQEFLNLLPFQAHTIGNHEFDNKVAGLVPFLKALNAPVVVSNMDASLHPELNGLFRKSIVIEVGGKKIGIVGVIYSKTNEIATTEKLIFSEETASVNAEADRLVNEEKVFTVIVLSHCGYDVDLRIAANARSSIGLIVGAHSHTLLYNGAAPNNETAGGPYPTLVDRPDGGKVLVVQASCFTKYLGDIQVTYDSLGQLKNWTGLPHYMDRNVVPDAAVVTHLAPYKAQVDALFNEIIGHTEHVLDNSYCWYGECTLGNLIADAMLTSFENQTDVTPPIVSFLNAGSIRTSIPQGDIAYYDLMLVQPFANSFDYGELTGEALMGCLEEMALPYGSSKKTVVKQRSLNSDVNILELSGLRVVLDLTRPEGSRVTLAKIREAVGSENYVDIDLQKTYSIVLLSFLVNGGDGFECFPLYLQNRRIGPIDIDVTKAYIKNNTPLDYNVEGRIEIITATSRNKKEKKSKIQPKKQQKNRKYA